MKEKALNTKNQLEYQLSLFKKYYASYKSLIVAYAQEYEADKYIDHIQIFNAAKDEWEEICEVFEIKHGFEKTKKIDTKNLGNGFLKKIEVEIKMDESKSKIEASSCFIE